MCGDRAGDITPRRRRCNYFENPLAVVVYSTAVAAVSGMEVVLFRHARRRALLHRPMPDDVYRWGVAVSLAPVGFVCLSIPLAFVNTTLAVASWFLAVPYQVFQNRRMPAHAEEYL